MGAFRGYDFKANPKISIGGRSNYKRRDDFVQLSSMMRDRLNFGVFNEKTSKCHYLGQNFGERVPKKEQKYSIGANPAWDDVIVRCLDELEEKINKSKSN